MCKFIALVAMGLFIASSALAVPPVTIEKNSDGSGWALGSQVAVLASGGSVDCYTLDGMAFCAIREAGGEHAVCVTRDPEMVAAVRGLPGCFGVYMAFDALANCTQLTTQMGTNYHPQ